MSYQILQAVQAGGLIAIPFLVLAVVGSIMHSRC